ncbi:MAG: hypothetical protein JNJ83_14375 [Verrucomicrobiaceae bacterium]|nr:hypothetical protein [Verrucomicrobiaceae bacterium]
MKSLLLLLGVSALSLPLASLGQGPSVVFGHQQLIEYQPGNLPLIISAPHGGTIRPEGMPNRSFGRIAQDSNTQEITRLLKEEVAARYGAPPYIIICRLHRMKMDANREIKEAAQDNPIAVQAWNDFQGFIKGARQSVNKKFGHGLYIDLHGQRHPENRVELGYLLTAEQLRLPDANLNGDKMLAIKTSVRELTMRTSVSFADLIRGPTSLGAMLERRGFASVPSPVSPAPLANEEYYSGGYNTAMHSSLHGGAISGLQIECPWKGVRDKPENQRKFARALAEALGEYWLAHFKSALKGAAP